MEFSATFCFFKDWTKTLSEMKFDSDGWLWFNEISSQKKFFYKAIFKRINANNSTLKNQCYRITAFSKNECYSFIHKRFWSFTTAESVMLFTNDGDTIKGMRRVKQAGVYSCLTLINNHFYKVLIQYWNIALFEHTAVKATNESWGTRQGSSRVYNSIQIHNKLYYIDWSM